MQRQVLLRLMIRCVVHWNSDIILKASQGLPIHTKPFQHPALQEIVIHLVLVINDSSTPGFLAPKTFNQFHLPPLLLHV